MTAQVWIETICLMGGVCGLSIVACLFLMYVKILITDQPLHVDDHKAFIQMISIGFIVFGAMTWYAVANY